MSPNFQFLMDCTAVILARDSLDDAICRGASAHELRALRAAYEARRHEHLELIVNSLPR